MSDQDEALKTGVMCYLHLWASLHKHVQLSHEEIAQGIDIWDDHGGGYFAAFTYGNRRLMQTGQTYVCALSDDGPMVGQLDKIPPCMPLNVDAQIAHLLEALARVGASQPADKTMQQVDVISKMIALKLPTIPKKKRTEH